MALCPFAEKKLLPENKTQPKIYPKAVIVHSQGGKGSLYNFWLNGTDLECHFWVSYDGKIEQYMDTAVRADANGEANTFAISIETESSVAATERWTEKQAAALVKLIDWACATHSIERSVMVDKNDNGLGWHVMFGAPGPWTKAAGKVCPGPARIDQFKKEIVPAVAKKGAPVANKVGFAPGDSGDGVKMLQAMLNILSGFRINSEGKLGGAKIEVNGVYGKRTTEAVRELERFGDAMSKLAGGPGIKVDGIAGREVLNIITYWVPQVLNK